MNTQDLRDVLAQRPLLCDGAMGTQLFARGLVPGACGELWNVDSPEDIEAIHAAYRDAGCDLITTNTFGGTAPTLQRHGLADRAAEINRAGARLAAKAAGSTGWVLGDIGPFGDFLQPLGDMRPETLHDIFLAQAAALYEGGADAIIVETMSDPAELAIAIRAARRAGAKPVLATCAFASAGGEFRTMMGSTVQDAIARAIDAGADAVGANCGTGLSLADYLLLAEQLVRAAGAVPVILQPNAGAPQMIDGKLTYRATPAEMATLVGPLLDLGVRIIGGCCGTTPEHLRAMKAALDHARR